MANFTSWDALLTQTKNDLANGVNIFAERYEMGGRKIQYRGLEDTQKYIDWLQMKVNQEKGFNGQVNMKPM